MDSPCIGNVGCLQFTWGNRWAHGLGKCKQNSGLINIPPESRLPFVQISSIYRITAAEVWDSFEAMEHEFSFGTFRPEKTRLYLFRCSVARANLPLERPKKLCSIYFPTGFSGNLSYMVCKHGVRDKRCACERRPHMWELKVDAAGRRLLAP